MIRLYPRPWRDRYGDELQAILEGLGVVRLAAPPGVRLRVARAS